MNNSGADFRDFKSVHVSRRLVHVVLGQYLLEHLKGLVKCVSVLIKAKCSEQISEHSELVLPCSELRNTRSSTNAIQQVTSARRGSIHPHESYHPCMVIEIYVCAEDSYLTMFTWYISTWFWVFWSCVLILIWTELLNFWTFWVFIIILCARVWSQIWICPDVCRARLTNLTHV